MLVLLPVVCGLMLMKPHVVSGTKSSFSVDDMTSMNQYLLKSRDSFVRNVTLEEKNLASSSSRRCGLFICLILTAHFNFTTELVTRLAHFDTNSVEITIRSYLLDNRVKTRSGVISQRADISTPWEEESHRSRQNVSSLVSASCRAAAAGPTDSVVCYERDDGIKALSTNETNQTEPLLHHTRRLRMLQSISFLIDNSNESLSYMVCIKFVNPNNSDFYFFTENMCLDGLVMGRARRAKKLQEEDESKEEEEEEESSLPPLSFRYKPLFIVIMYAMCFSLLGAIAIAHHILTKAKAKKVLLMKQLKRRASRSRRATMTGSQITLGSDPLAARPLLVSKTTPLPVKSSQSINSNTTSTTSHPIAFSGSGSTLNNDRKQKVGSMERAESFEADHILNDKPWACRATTTTQVFPTSLSGAGFYLEEETSQDVRDAAAAVESAGAEKQKHLSTTTSVSSNELLAKNAIPVAIDIHPELLLPESNLINSRRSFNLSNSKLISKPYMVLETNV